LAVLLSLETPAARTSCIGAWLHLAQQKETKTKLTWEAPVLCVKVHLPLLEQVAHNSPQAVDKVDVVTPAGHVL
jgi:hypothetical protein